MTPDETVDIEQQMMYRAYCICGWKDEWIASRHTAIINADNHECKEEDDRRNRTDSGQSGD